MHTNTKILLLLLFVLVICLSSQQVYAFGAGNIPSFAYMEGRAFRHGDIEDVLAEIAKKGGGGFAIGNLLGKSKFGGLDIKRVYFGNWLRDYSQAVDLASLKKLQLQTIINLCMALGFLAHGYATAEFEVTEERLGVYLPVEHIDNPKGYGEGEDPRKYHRKLRGPVDPRELEIDPRTGMKNYIANESGNWDTSKALVRRLLQQCIHIGRQARSNGRKEDEYESLRLLGTLLHTLEDFSAHSNFCELALVSMGHRDVFVHVGDQVRVQAPNGRSVAPLVTGTFGGSDFIHSMLGEAGDHISSASVSDLNKTLDTARARSAGPGPGERGGPGSGGSPADTLRNLLFTLPGGSGGDMSREIDGIERIRAGPAQGGKNPDQMSPQELHAVLWEVLSFRDSIVKKISATIEKIPGLGPLIEKLMESIQVFIFTTLEPFLKPIMKSASAGLMSASSEVIDTHDQYEVFNDPRASDPTHSFLSKDHFNLILNEPAGKIAKVIVQHTVGLVVKAWDDKSANLTQISEEVLQCLFHPDFHNNGSKIQSEMMNCLHEWARGLGNKEHEILRRLSKSCVRNHENIRLGGEGGVPAAQGTQAYNAGVQAQHDVQNYLSGIPGVAQAQSLYNQFSPQQSGPRRDLPGPTTDYKGGPPQPYSLPSGTREEPPHSPGHAASFFQGGASGGAPPSGYNAPSSYGPPSGPPPGPSYPGQTPSSYGPPSGPPPASFMPSPSGGFGGPPAPGGPGGYAPSYAPSYASSPPPPFPGGPGGGGLSMPGAGGGFPGASPGFDGGFPGAAHGFPSPPGPPPGGAGFPSPFAPPPGFPDAGPPHGHGHQHQHHHHQDQNQGGYGPPGGFQGGW